MIALALINAFVAGLLIPLIFRHGEPGIWPWPATAALAGLNVASALWVVSQS